MSNTDPTMSNTDPTLAKMRAALADAGLYGEPLELDGKGPDWISGAAVIDSEMTYYLDEGEGSERPEWQQQEIRKALAVATAAPELYGALADLLAEVEYQARLRGADALIEAAHKALAAARGETN